MKAYVTVKRARKAGWYGEVVTEQDYHDGGPFAHSYRTPIVQDIEQAQEAAVHWCGDYGCEIIDARDMAAA